MAWVKIPVENHPIFLAALPRDPRISTLQMFGGIAAKVNGHMMAGLFARSAMVRLSKADQEAALALDGAEPFDPMGNKRVMNDTILLPEDVMDDPAQLRDWLARALAFTATLSPKPPGHSRSKQRPRAKPTAAKPPAANLTAATPRAKPIAAKPPATLARARPNAASPNAAKPTAAKPSATTLRGKPKAAARPVPAPRRNARAANAMVASRVAAMPRAKAAKPSTPVRRAVPKARA